MSTGFDPVYNYLRNLTSPVAAITTSAGGRRNGFIVNSAQRASLVPSMPRLSIYVSKPAFSHDLIYASGVFALHLLRNDQWPVIHRLGFESGRDNADKLAEFNVMAGVTGCPLLEDCIAGFECRVVNAMDTGASTFFIGDVINVLEGKPGPIMTSEYFRAHLTAEWKERYETNLRAAGVYLEPLTRQIDRTRIWPGPTVSP